MPSTSRVRSLARLSLARPTFDRWERPVSASVRAWRLQPGRLAQGPEEKCGVVGRTPGVAFVMLSILPDRRPSVGRGFPRPGIVEVRGRRQARRGNNSVSVETMRLLDTKARDPRYFERANNVR